MAKLVGWRIMVSMPIGCLCGEREMEGCKGLVMVLGAKVGFAAENGWYGVAGWEGVGLVLLVELVERVQLDRGWFLWVSGELGLGMGGEGFESVASWVSGGFRSL
jgi:hypothetical protein